MNKTKLSFLAILFFMAIGFLIHQEMLGVGLLIGWGAGYINGATNGR